MPTLAFEVFGTATGQPPLIILHGFFASSRTWRLLAGKLADKRQVYVLDMRNHGASEHHPVMDYPTMAADVLHFMNRQGIASASLLGHSMGGKTAMWFALNYPDYIDKLVVVDIAPVSYTHSFASLIAALKSLPLTGLDNRKQAETYLAAAIPDLSYRQFLLQNLLLDNGVYRWRVDLDIFARAADAIVAFPPAQHLQPFSGQTLFVKGADSAYMQAAHTTALFPTGQMTVIAKAGHWLHVQQPQAFLAEVGRFLA
ncbi:MAG: alpha/beta fold hydrolase [Methylovulum sp.]|nr:alpha/beta fold hydrolase [Methylovulum sp.]